MARRLSRHGGAALIYCVDQSVFVETPMTSVNKFPMPFIITAERAAKYIVRGIERGTPEIVFPPAMALMMRIAKLVPKRIWPKLFKRG